MAAIRSATPADTPALKAILEAAEPIDRAGRVDLAGAGQWREPDSWDDVIVAEQDGAIVGYGALLWPTAPDARDAEVVVHPAWRRRGHGRQLVGRLRAMAAASGQTLQGEYASHNPAAAAYVAALGGELIGRWHQMVADPVNDFAPPPLPAGYRLRNAVVGQDEAGFADVFRDSFSDHRFMSTPQVESVRRRWQTPEFDPGRFAFAEYDGQIVGVSALRPAYLYRGGRLAQAGHIGPVGTRSAHRSRGLARAMMVNNLAYIRRQGWPVASLAVDEINHTAQALYRSLGFAVAYDWIWWRLALPQAA
jgi:mycothiol synthase